jgi:hypothetical protein
MSSNKDKNQNEPDISVQSSNTVNKSPSQSTREYWKEEEEKILRDWADKAQCYELMHSKSHEIYNYRNTLFVIPVIIISTITGTANFAQDRVPADKQAAFVMTVGAFNILAAIISTIAQYLKISELNESYRVGTLQWGKFYRNIKTELAKHPLDRVPPTNMLSMCKEEFDRLLEIYPDIPQKVISIFNSKFDDVEGISKPEICDVIEPTTIYPMTFEERREMIRKINNIPDTPDNLSENEIILNENSDDDINKKTPLIEDTPEQKEYKEKLTKFKQAFYKMNNRNPTKEEIKESYNFMFGDEQSSSPVIPRRTMPEVLNLTDSIDENASNI